MDVEQLAQDLSARVREALTQAEARAREIIAEAEDRARQVVADAESEAKRIRERAEGEADQRLARVREALSGLEGVLGGTSSSSVARTGDAGSPADTAAEVDPGPVTVPEPTPQPMPEPTPPTEPEPMPPAEPEPSPPGPEIEPPAPAQPDREAPAAINGGSARGDEIGARIVATKMALDGSSRDEIAAHLAKNYEVSDPETLLDFVMERAKR